MRDPGQIGPARPFSAAWWMNAILSVCLDRSFESAWREGLREITKVVAVSLAVALLLGGTIYACTRPHLSDPDEWQSAPQ